MGQYYKVCINYLGGKKEDTYYSDRRVKGEGRELAKLIEHSYFGNVLMDSVADVLHHYETKLAWIGDYSEKDEVADITKGEASYDDCWGDDSKDDFEFNKAEFDYFRKFLVNLTKKEYISFDDYMKKAKSEWQLNPISIMTAIGNGRGGGDYFSRSKRKMNLVGSWAWDVITIDDEEPKGMRKLNVDFGCTM